MIFDPAAIRVEFPIFRAEPELHYLDSAATAQIHERAAQALLAYETTYRSNVKRGIYRLAARADEAFQAARASIARFLGALPEEVVFTSGATLALNLAAHSLGAGLRQGDEVVVSLLEHHSNLVPWQMLCERTGARMRAIGVTSDGRLDLDGLGDVVTDRCRIVAVTHTSNVTGAVTDLGPIVDAAQSVGARVVVDGAQRAPHGPIDVPALGVDAYIVSGHKMFGPTGVGVIWLRDELAQSLPPFLGGGEMIRTVTMERTTYAASPHRFEAGTPPIGPAIGLGAAAEFLSGIDWSAALAHELSLTGRLIDGLQRREGIRILGPTGLQGRLGVVSFAAEGVHAHDLCQMLDAFGVCLRGGHHCAQPLMEAFDIAATARASIALYNTDDDIEALLHGLDRTLERLR